MNDGANMAQRYEREIPEGYEARIEGNKVIIELKETESEEERIRKELIKFISEVKRISENGCETWAVRKSDADMCAAFLSYLERLKEQKPILEVFGFKVGDAVRLKDGDGRKHIIKSFEEVEGIHGPNFYQVEFEDNSARDGIYPGEEYPNGYYTQMEKFEEEQKPSEWGEDEKIRKAVYRIIEQTNLIDWNYTKEQMLAWLKKQKEEEGYETIPVESTLEYKLGFKAGQKKMKEDIEKGFGINEHSLDYLTGRYAGYTAAKAEQKPEWSEEDEKMVQFWNMYYEHKVGDWSNKDVVEHLERFREWLNTRFKSLRPRQDAGWNKEDEEYLSQAIETLEHENYTLIAENLKSLRPRWKPSKEHPVEWKDEYREEDLRTRFAFYTYKNEEDDSVLYLSNVFVEEASRNAGFGTKILEAAEKVAETIGAITIRLKVKQDSPANAWYRKRGYGYIAFEGEYDWLEKNLEYLKPKRNKQERVEGLEEEIKSYFNGWCNDDEYGQAVMPDCCCASVDDCKDIARHFYELGCCRTAVMYDEIEYNRQRAEEAENEEFEKELHQYWLEQKREGVIVDGSIDDYITVQEVARHFAEWGAEHLKR